MRDCIAWVTRECKSMKLLSQCRTLGCNNKEMHRPSPQILSGRTGTCSFTVPLYLCGRASKSSTATTFHLHSLPSTCFSKTASRIRILLSFLLLGCFHWQGYDVHFVQLLSNRAGEWNFPDDTNRVFAAALCQYLRWRQWIFDNSQIVCRMHEPWA